VTYESSGALLRELGNLDSELDDFNKNARQGVLNKMTDRLNERLRQHDDLEEKLRELEVGVQTADIRLADRKSKLDPNDTQIEKLNEVEKELNDIDRETKRIRKDKDDTVSRIHNLLVRISKSDPDNCNLSELMELCQNCEENTDTLSDDIDASLERLRALNDCLDSVLERIRAEKR
jgi:chromosome segregation ATPase